MPAGVAKHHALQDDGGAHVGVDLVDAPVLCGFVGVPRGKHRRDGARELFLRILREGAARMGFVQGQKAAGELAQLAEIEQPLILALGDSGDLGLEQAGGQPGHHFAVAGHQAPVGVPGHARVAGLAHQAGQGVVAQPDVEQGFEHARHRHRGARAHRQDERVAVVAKQQVGAFLQRVQTHGKHWQITILRGVGVVRSDDQCHRDVEPGLGHAVQVVAFGTHGVRRGLVQVLACGRAHKVQMLGQTGAGLHADIPVLLSTIWRSA